jgi:hypothetical protein
MDGIAAQLGAGHPLTPGRINAVMRRAATSDVFASRIVPFLSAAVAGLPPDADKRHRLIAATRLIETWVADGAPLVAVGTTLPHPGVTLYRAFRTIAQHQTFADELTGYQLEMFYPLVNEGNQEDDHGSYGTPDALFYRALQGPDAASRCRATTFAISRAASRRVAIRLSSVRCAPRSSSCRRGSAPTTCRPGSSRACSRPS